jgi:hypothetical protein
VFHQFIHALVVVVGVVVEETKLFDAGLERERDGIVHTTVSPAGMLLVFRPVVLRVEDEHVSVAHKVNHFVVVATGARFGVGKKGDEAVGRKQPVADTDARMVRALRTHEHGADGEVEVLEFLDFDVAGQFVERHGKVGAFHLAGERGDESLARAFAAKNPQLAARIVNRPEKRQSLNVIPMCVCEEQRKIQRLAFELLEQRLPQRAQAGSRVEDDDVVTAADFDARGVAAIAHGCRARRGNGAAHAPEFYASASFDGITLARLERNTNRKTKSRNRRVLVPTRTARKKSCAAARVIYAGCLGGLVAQSVEQCPFNSKRPILASFNSPLQPLQNH